MTAPDPRPTERFSDRVDAYSRFRPGYPPDVLRAIREGLGVAPPAVVIDLGAGTGIFSAALLDDGFEVIAVEPNAAMREAAARALQGRERFTLVAASAEETGLPDACADLAVAAQAFHWFDPARARVEILRVTRPPHRAAIVWNTRLLDATPFLRDYDALLLRLSDDYAKVRHQNVGHDTLAAFFAPRGFQRRSFPSEQTFDEEAFLGRALSSSYVPGPSHPRHAETVRELSALFARHQRGGAVAFLYDTEVYLGCLDPSPQPRDGASNA